jgi:hypothetical protein
MLLRPGLDERLRQEAIEGLAAAEGRAFIRVAIDALGELDARQGLSIRPPFSISSACSSRGRPASWPKSRGDMERMATSARRPQLRRIGYVALTAIDALGGGDPSVKVWELAKANRAARRSGRGACRWRAIRVPHELSTIGSCRWSTASPAAAPVKPGTVGRFVRVELPGKQRTLTLAEVEVYAGNENVARAGKATQVNVAAGGEPGRAIDGNTHPEYGRNGQTHTQEGIENPWWEVDLGSPKTIDRIVIFNRGDGLAGRLKDFRLSILDGERQEVQAGEPAGPEPSSEFAVASEKRRLTAAVRRAAFAGGWPGCVAASRRCSSGSLAVRHAGRSISSTRPSRPWKRFRSAQWPAAARSPHARRPARLDADGLRGAAVERMRASLLGNSPAT